MGLREKVALVFIVVITVQISTSHCKPSVYGQDALQRYMDTEKFKTTKSPYMTSGNLKMKKNSSLKKSLIKEFNFPENEYPSDASNRDYYSLGNNFKTNSFGTVAKSSSASQCKAVEDFKKDLRMKRKLDKITEHYHAPDTEPTFPKSISGSDSVVLTNKEMFPEVQYPLNALDTWAPHYWNPPTIGAHELDYERPESLIFNPKSSDKTNKSYTPYKKQVKSKVKQFMEDIDTFNEKMYNSKAQKNETTDAKNKKQTSSVVKNDFNKADSINTNISVLEPEALSNKTTEILRYSIHNDTTNSNILKIKDLLTELYERNNTSLQTGTSQLMPDTLNSRRYQIQEESNFPSQSENKTVENVTCYIFNEERDDFISKEELAKEVKPEIPLCMVISNNSYIDLETATANNTDIVKTTSIHSQAQNYNTKAILSTDEPLNINIPIPELDVFDQTSPDYSIKTTALPDINKTPRSTILVVPVDEYVNMMEMPNFSKLSESSIIILTPNKKKDTTVKKISDTFHTFPLNEGTNNIPNTRSPTEDFETLPNNSMCHVLSNDVTCTNVPTQYYTADEYTDATFMLEENNISQNTTSFLCDTNNLSEIHSEAVLPSTSTILYNVTIPFSNDFPNRISSSIVPDSSLIHTIKDTVTNINASEILIDKHTKQVNNFTSFEHPKTSFTSSVDHVDLTLFNDNNDEQHFSSGMNKLNDFYKANPIGSVNTETAQEYVTEEIKNDKSDGQLSKSRNNIDHKDFIVPNTDKQSEHLIDNETSKHNEDTIPVDKLKENVSNYMSFELPETTFTSSVDYVDHTLFNDNKDTQHFSPVINKLSYFHQANPIWSVNTETSPEYATEGIKIVISDGQLSEQPNDTVQEDAMLPITNNINQQLINNEILKHNQDTDPMDKLTKQGNNYMSFEPVPETSFTSSVEHVDLTLLNDNNDEQQFSPVINKQSDFHKTNPIRSVNTETLQGYVTEGIKNVISDNQLSEPPNDTVYEDAILKITDKHNQQLIDSKTFKHNQDTERKDKLIKQVNNYTSFDLPETSLTSSVVHADLSLFNDNNDEQHFSPDINKLSYLQKANPIRSVNIESSQEHVTEGIKNIISDGQLFEQTIDTIYKDVILPNTDKQNKYLIDNEISKDNQGTANFMDLQTLINEDCNFSHNNDSESIAYKCISNANNSNTEEENSSFPEENQVANSTLTDIALNDETFLEGKITNLDPVTDELTPNNKVVDLTKDAQEGSESVTLQNEPYSVISLADSVLINEDRDSKQLENCENASYFKYTTDTSIMKNPLQQSDTCDTTINISVSNESVEDFYEAEQISNKTRLIFLNNSEHEKHMPIQSNIDYPSNFSSFTDNVTISNSDINNDRQSLLPGNNILAGNEFQQEGDQSIYLISNETLGDSINIDYIIDSDNNNNAEEYQNPIQSEISSEESLLLVNIDKKDCTDTEKNLSLQPMGTHTNEIIETESTVNTHPQYSSNESQESLDEVLTETFLNNTLDGDMPGNESTKLLDCIEETYISPISDVIRESESGNFMATDTQLLEKNNLTELSVSDNKNVKTFPATQLTDIVSFNPLKINKLYLDKALSDDVIEKEIIDELFGVNSFNIYSDYIDQNPLLIDEALADTYYDEDQ